MYINRHMYTYLYSSWQVPPCSCKTRQKYSALTFKKAEKWRAPTPGDAESQPSGVWASHRDGCILLLVLPPQWEALIFCLSDMINEVIKRQGQWVHTHLTSTLPLAENCRLTLYYTYMFGPKSLEETEIVLAMNPSDSSYRSCSAQKSKGLQ